MRSFDLLGFCCVFALGACSSGGGSTTGMAGGGANTIPVPPPPPPAVAPFTDWAAAGSQSVILSGSWRESTFTVVLPPGAATRQITAVASPTPFAPGTFQQVNTSVDSRDGRLREYTATWDLETLEIYGNAAALGWNYQTFGAWGYVATTTMGRIGAFTGGTGTPAAALALPSQTRLSV
jgi:hypothetical protein